MTPNVGCRDVWLEFLFRTGGSSGFESRPGNYSGHLRDFSLYRIILDLYFEVGHTVPEPYLCINVRFYVLFEAI
jgi:hypothetical protein